MSQQFVRVTIDVVQAYPAIPNDAAGGYVVTDSRGTRWVSQTDFDRDYVSQNSTKQSDIVSTAMKHAKELSSNLFSTETPPHIRRMMAESIALSTDLVAMHKFMTDNPLYETLPSQAQYQMSCQFDAMREYFARLVDRIPAEYHEVCKLTPM